MASYADFATCYASATVGATVSVTDGTVPPTGDHSSRAYQEWRGRNFSGTLVSKIAGPPRQMTVTLDGFNVIVTVTEPSGWTADNTAATTARQTLSKSSAIVQCDAGGNPKPGEVPVIVVGKRYKGGTEVTTAANWSGGGAGYGLSGSTFSFSSLTGATTTAFIQSDLDGVTLIDAFQITKVVDATTPSNTGASTNTFVLGSGTSFTSASTAVYTFPNTKTKRAGYAVTLTADISFQVAGWSSDRTGQGYIYGKWQYAVSGSGTWTDADTPAMTTSPCSYNAATSSGTDGNIRIVQSPTLVDGTVYQFRLLLQIDTAYYTTMSSPFIITAGSGTVVT